MDKWTKFRSVLLCGIKNSWKNISAFAGCCKVCKTFTSFKKIQSWRVVQLLDLREWKKIQKYCIKSLNTSLHYFFFAATTHLKNIHNIYRMQWFILITTLYISFTSSYCIIMTYNSTYYEPRGSYKLKHRLFSTQQWGL